MSFLYVLGWIACGLLGAFLDALNNGRLSAATLKNCLLLGPLALIFTFCVLGSDTILWRRK